jgi:hypothetical protein
MKKLMLAVACNVAVLCPFGGQSFAASVTFTGVIDEIRGHPPQITVGDAFSAMFFFHPNPPDTFGEFGGTIGRYSITVGDFTFSGTEKFYGGVEFLTDPSQGSVLYQLFPTFYAPISSLPPYDAASVEITLQTGTGHGIPPLDQFALNDLGIGFHSPNIPGPDDAFGHLTSFPTFDLTQVPDNGASASLLSCGLAALAVLRFKNKSPLLRFF